MCGDVLCVFGHYAITRRILGPKGSYKYGGIGVEEENLKKTRLEQTECVNWPKKTNVHRNRSFCGRGSYTPVVLMLRILR